MPKLAENAVPSYRLHKQSGQAIVTLNGQDITLGRYGTRASRDRYNQIIGEWLAAGRRLPEKVAASTIAEVVNAYRKHADVYYRHADGTPTSSVERLARELSPLAKLYARLPAAELSPLKVKAVRDSMIKLGWSRGSINHAVGTIKRLVKWAVENELIPPAVHHGVVALEGLKQGRSPAKESEPVRPVPAAHLKTIPPLLSRQVRAMVELQAVSAMRPGEVCAMRTGEIDRSGKLWVYRPRQHKTQHHGHAREVYLGPKAQETFFRRRTQLPHVASCAHEWPLGPPHGPARHVATWRWVPVWQRRGRPPSALVPPSRKVCRRCQREQRHSITDFLYQLCKKRRGRACVDPTTAYARPRPTPTCLQRRGESTA